jgi:hypothetical protein
MLMHVLQPGQNEHTCTVPPNRAAWIPKANRCVDWQLCLHLHSVYSFRKYQLLR